MPVTSQEAGRRLYVGNIHYEVTDGELRELVAAHAGVEALEIRLDRVTRLSRGFGYVTLVSAADVETTIRALSGAHLHNRTLRVSLAKPRPGDARQPSRPARDGGI